LEFRLVLFRSQARLLELLEQRVDAFVEICPMRRATREAALVVDPHERQKRLVEIGLFLVRHRRSPGETPPGASSPGSGQPAKLVAVVSQQEPVAGAMLP